MSPKDGPRRLVIPAERSAVARYGGMVGGLVVATALTAALGARLEHTVFLVFWPVVIGAAWFGGRGPAALASLLAVITVNHLLVAPVGSVRPRTADDLLPLAVFLLVTFIISDLIGAARAEQDRATQATQVNAEYRAQLDAGVQQADQFARNIVDSISDPFVVIDADWRFQFVNAAAERVFAGSGHAGMIGRQLWETYPNVVGTDFERNMRRAAEDRVPVSFEAYYDITGEWSATVCYPLPQGGIVAQWQNITERKRSEEAAHYLSIATSALASSLDYEETLARLAAAVVPQLGDWCVVQLLEDAELKQVAVAHVDPAKIEFARDFSTKYPTPLDAPAGAPKVLRTGVPELYADITDEMLVGGARDADHLHLLRSLSMRGVIIAPLQAGDSVIGTLSLVAAESGRRYTQADVPLVMEIARRAALAVENARLHRSALLARAEAESLQHEAEAANVAKTQFLTSMSHELRTPLNAIAGYADLMSLGIHGPVTDAQMEDLERIKRNQRHLLGIINDILSFARLDAGRVEYAITDVSAFEVMDELSPMIRPQVAGRQLEMVTESVARDVSVRADRERLRQVLINLLSNAIKFTPAGGQIVLRCHADMHVVEFAVADTGIGIPRDRLTSIFEPFVQVNRSLAQPVEGTGLGLAISREMVEGMGGTLTVSSEQGKGSEFKVTLPRSPT